MEIAFFTDSYAPTRDGVASVTGSLARALTRLGHRVRVYTTNPVVGAPRDELTDAGVRVVRLRSLRVPLYTDYRWPVFPYLSLRGEHVGEDVDIVHLHTPGEMGTLGFLASRRFGKPLVGTFHTNLWDMRGSVPQKFLVPLFFRIAWWYNVGLYWRCDVTTAPSEVARDALVAHARKPFHRAIEVVPNGIDLDRFHPLVATPDWRLRVGFPPGPLVTYLGRLTADKGIHRFLDAVEAASARTALVAIVGGSGPEEGRVRERLATSPVLATHVRYVGPVAEEEKAALLAQSDMFVVPSTSDTAGVALLEAMACGTPCIALESGGPVEIVEDGVTGRTVPLADPPRLAAAIVELADAPALRRSMGVQALRRVRTVGSIDGMARRLITLYEMLLTERRTPASYSAR